ncbi:MAG: type Z 30S ribosomal protein S14 [Deltaproteobacteria bacterium]|nr:type Z 30S ribosomal protein S14 [Deltaproteobacteria bacterium]
MAKTCWMVKAQRAPKFPVRKHNRCLKCGRSRGYYRKFALCRLCFRGLASRGEVPGVRKASW